jgi:cytochrome c peroxidase
MKLHRIHWLALASVVAAVALATGVQLFLIREEGGSPIPVQRAPAARQQVDSGVVQPLPESVPLNPTQVELGRRLFHDPRLSSDDTVSCANCHLIQKYGVDGLQVSAGVRGRQGEMNAPSVFNSGFNFRQFWDGRAATLEDQINGPVANPLEMNTDWPAVLKKLDADPELQALSRDGYGRRLDADAVRSAIATFERSLITPDSPFDRFLRGDEAALDEQARLGWRRFKELGCIACHQGINLGGNMYATMGVMGDYFKDRPIRRSDLGLFNRTDREEDKFKFKVPSLRNVVQTAPYFHDGRVKTLDEAVRDMGMYQLGLDLGQDDRDALVAFLNSLTGKLPPGVQ